MVCFLWIEGAHPLVAAPFLLERTIGRGWQRGRPSEGRVCVWVCVQGLRGSKASHFGILMLTQPPETRRPWRGSGLPCHPWQGIAGHRRDT